MAAGPITDGKPYRIGLILRKQAARWVNGAAQPIDLHACPYLLVSLSGDGPSHPPPLLEARPSRFLPFVCVRHTKEPTESVGVSCLPIHSCGVVRVYKYRYFV